MHPSGYTWASWLPPHAEGLWPMAALFVLGAMLGEFVARITKLPRVVGYTAAGYAAAALGGGVVVPLDGFARTAVDLALALLLFEIGSRVHLRWLRRNPGLLAMSLLESVLGAAAVSAALLALGFEVHTALTCALLAVPASAAVAGRVALELGADGQVTQRMALLTALNTLYAVLATILLQLWWATGQAPDVLSASATLARSFFGSLVLAGVLAGTVALAARRLDLRNESAVLLLFGLVVLAVSAARPLGLSTLLVPLLAGVILRNTTERPWVWPRHFGTAGGALVLMLFVIVGSSWSPAVLLAGGVGAVVLVLARAVGKGGAVILLAPWSKASLKQGLALSVTLTPLSATALVMLSELMRGSPGLASEAAPIILTSIALLELVGPMAVQLALRMSGETNHAKRNDAGGTP